MNNTDITPATARAEAAEAARVALTDTLTTAKGRTTAALVKAYGTGTTTGHVSLAIRVADVLAGGKKPRGGAADRINRVIRSIDEAEQLAGATGEAFTLDARTVLTYAREVMDAHAAESKAARDAEKADRKAAKDVLNNRGASKADRIAAAELMADIDALPAARKAEALHARVSAAIEAAKAGGMTRESLQSIIDGVYPVLTVSIVDDLAA